MKNRKKKKKKEKSRLANEVCREDADLRVASPHTACQLVPNQKAVGPCLQVYHSRGLPEQATGQGFSAGRRATGATSDRN
jgi:hypothetical protein